MRQAMIVAAISLSVVALGNRVLAATVFDNTVTYTGLDHELLPAGQAHSEEHGNQITLAGSERFANELRFVLRIHGAGVASFDYRVRFYENDGPGGEPGTLFYESEPIRRVIDSGAPLTYSLPLPNVLMQDTFTWTVQVMNRTGNMAKLGPSEYNPPTVGSAPFGYWRRAQDTEEWEYAGLAEAPFGARLTAEMAPAGVEDSSSPGFALRAWPNPTVGSVVFELAGSEAERAVVNRGPLLILDSVGRVVHERLDTRFPWQWTPDATLAAGTYFAMLGSKEDTKALRFVVVR